MISQRLFRNVPVSISRSVVMQEVFYKPAVVRIAIVLWCCVMCGGEAFAKVKVHKGSVSVSQPDSNGMVSVIGAPGAIESTGNLRLEIQRIESTPIKANADGSFEAEVAANAGDKLIVIARDGARKSVGTFRVQGGGDKEADKPIENKDNKATKSANALPHDNATPPPTKNTVDPSATNVAYLPKADIAVLPGDFSIMIAVVDNKTGIVHLQRGVSAVAKDNQLDDEEAARKKEVFFERVLDRCLSIARRELRSARYERVDNAVVPVLQVGVDKPTEKQDVVSGSNYDLRGSGSD